VVGWIARENSPQNATSRAVAPSDDAEQKGIDWSSISSNVIATVLGGALLGLCGGVIYLAIQVPRQQELILANQAEMKLVLNGLTVRMERLEMNDRRQDEKLIRMEHSRP
jgi:hypothetical protein